LQHALYRAAKADPGRRFHALRDKVYRRGVLQRAWVQVRRNSGAAGIDGKTIADVEQYGVTRLLDELAADLRDGRGARSRPAGCSYRNPAAGSSARCRSRRCVTGSRRQR
jgi:RNA-directed DNA polymerase